MLPSNLSDLTFDHVQRLVDARAAESTKIDFKQSLPADARALAPDVCAFANTQGGDLIYGVIEIDSHADSICGVEVPSEDKLKLRLTNMIRTSVEPQVHGIQMAFLQSGLGTTVVVLRVPKSWSGPHRLPGGAFYARGANSNYQLDIQSVRNAFLAGDSLSDKLRSFRAGRVARIAAGDGPTGFASNVFAVFHLIPLSSFGKNDFLRIHELSNICRMIMPPFSNGGFSALVTIDGLLNYYGVTPSQIFSYAMILRNGGLEIAMDIKGNFDSVASKGFEICANLHVIELSLIDTPGLSQYLRVLAELEAEPPFMAAISLIGVKGMQPATSPGMFGFQPIPPKDNVILLSEVVIEDKTLPPGRALRPVFDAMWNCFGVERSPYFDDQDRFRKS